MKKGDKLEGLAIETMASEGKCVARHEGLVVFLQGGAPGDVVDAELTKIKSTFLEARVTAIRRLSPHRAAPICEHFGICGGCSWQHINYSTQLLYKQKQVVDNLERIGGLDLPPVKPILASAHTDHYRNKLDFTFTANRWLTKEELQVALENKTYEAGLGYHMPRAYDRVFDVKRCHLQADPSNAIRLLTKEVALKEGIPFFDLRKQIGFLRTLTIRTAKEAKEVMVILQVTYDKMEWIEKILEAITSQFPRVTSANYIINGKKNDTFADLEVICWKGKPYITETMPRPAGNGTLQFRIGPKSFYQTNSLQAYELYRTAWQMANLKGNEVVFDLYTGTGTIANFVAAHARRVIGLEYVEAAVQDARENSRLNDIHNTEFFSGDMKDLLNDDFLNTHGRPDVVITDPPRAGMHEDVCRMLLKARPHTIIYVSCNPATQARDLKLLDEQYRIVDLQPVDMFPHTMHVENVAALVLK